MKYVCKCMRNLGIHDKAQPRLSVKFLLESGNRNIILFTNLGFDIVI